MKVLISDNDRKYLVRDTDKDYHTQYGFIKAEDLKKTGELVKSNTNMEFRVLDATFLDKYLKIARGPQTIPLKDIGAIITRTGIDKKSVVLDAGVGSGGMTCVLAHICKKVYAYDLREDFIAIAKKNVEALELKNVIIKKGNVYEKIGEKNLDMVNLDVPEPWLALENVGKALKLGGFMVAYTPTIIQASDLVNQVTAGFIHITTIEIIEREWEIKERKVRPKSIGIGHSGFLTYLRKVS